MNETPRKFPPVIHPPAKEKTQLPPQDKLQKQGASETMIVVKVRPQYTIARDGKELEQLAYFVASKEDRYKMPRLRIRPGMEIKVTIVKEAPNAKSR